jgi:hypothetical protein
MTSSQLDDSIPAIMPVIRDGKRVEIEFRGASYGYGLFIYAPGGRAALNGSLASPSSFGHAAMVGHTSGRTPNENSSVSISASRRG